MTCENADGTNNSAQIETINTLLTNGTYYVKVVNEGNNNNMILNSICITGSVISGNFTCASATTLPCATTNLAGTTVGSSNTAHGTACSMANYGAWYTFVGDGQITTISSTAGSGYDHEMSISSGSCGSFTSLTCQDNGLSGGTETYTFTTSLGVNYYVYIAHYSSGSTTTGTFTISRTCTAAPTPPANDNCNTATPLTINTSCSYSTYTTVGATTSTTPSTPPAPGCGNYTGGDVWFSFIVPANGEVTVDTQTGGITDSGMAWYTGTCGSLTLLECDDDDSANGAMSSITRTGLTPGTTIYVRVWEYGNDVSGTFGICATSPGPCVTPGSQASGFTAGTITSTDFPATFSGTADSYLVIRSTSATPPSQPVNGVIYSSANIGTLGSGLTVVQNGTSTSISGTGLTGNTHYYYYIYAYNNTGCSGGPLYNTSGPLTGNTVTCPSTPSSVSTSSTLSSINFSWVSSLGGGANAVTYQLQVTTDAGYTANVAGSPFTISDPTTTYNLTGLSSNTTYYYRIRANNGCWSSYTTGSAITGYCAFTSSTSTYWISNFSTTGGSTNINRNSNYSAGGYANYSGTDIVSQILGQSFNFSTTMSSGTHGINIYVDWNNDLDFNDAGELVFASGGYVGSATGTITIPPSTSIGNHRMRVVANYFDTNPSACGSNSYTEAEDYTINVVAPVACSGTPNAGTTTITPNTGWPGSNYLVSNTGYSIASNLTFQWQFSTDGGATWTNAGASSGSYSDYSATAPTSGLVHWQLAVTCTNSGITSTSSVEIFTTIEVSDVVTGCPNVVSGGLGLNGADPAPINCTASSTCVDLEATYLDLGETTDYIVEPILYNPPFSFSGLANPVSVNVDDVWSPVVNLPFDFCFYGNTYNQCVIGSNGILTFNTSVAGGSSGYSFSNNIPISGDGRLLENSIFGVFHDINPGVGGEVGWELITLPTGCRALVASWYNVPMFDENSILYTGMMVLYENSNIIEVYIQEKNIDNFGAGTWNDGNAIVGIQNATGTLASVPPGRNGLDTNWATANEAWRFVPNGNSIASIAWYEGSGTSGPIVGTTPTLNVCPTSTTTYTAEITYTLCDGRTIKEIDETTVTVNGAKVWNGSVNTDWNIANNWHLQEFLLH
ncbi:GEVED domain-containing protein [Flavobacterium sp.]|uniref:GEVED domain-containing protein n=3 Tax=Flavobacterium sp. TaxID=239 RepID=UPI0040487420